MDWYIEISIVSPIIIMIFLGLTAGIFEEIGRYLGFKTLKTFPSTFEIAINKFFKLVTPDKRIASIPP